MRWLEGLGQLGFDFDGAARPAAQRNEGVEDDLFLSADPCELFIGAQRLEVYLSENGLGWVVGLAILLKELDYVAFMRAYQPTGRRAQHPRVMLGLVVYGILNRQWSLRELEGLARRVVGMWWSPARPQHYRQIYPAARRDIKRDVLRRLGETPGQQTKTRAGHSGGDGTVIEAAASHYRLLRSEVVIAAAHEAQAAAQASPTNSRLAHKAAAAHHAGSLAEERMRLRQRRDRGRQDIPLSPIEPEAVLQPRKDGVSRPSYKPSAMVHEAGLIVGQHVEPTSERDALKPILDQHLAAYGQMPMTVLLDAGFSSFPVLALMVEHDIDV